MVEAHVLPIPAKMAILLRVKEISEVVVEH